MINKWIIFLVVSILYISCNEENPLLVNPPPKNTTVKVRFINLAQDKNIRSLDLNGLKIENIAFANSSASMQPDADSAYLKIFNSNNMEFEQSQQIKFLRNTNYTFVGLTRGICSEAQSCKIDTIITLRTSAALPDDPNMSLIKFMNAFPDTNFKYFIKLGCPSGEVLFSSLNYLQYSISPIVLQKGTYSISLLKTNSIGLTKEQFIGLFEMQLDGKTQYTIILDKFDGKESLELLNENDFTTNNLALLPTIEDRKTDIRVLNLSGNSIDVNKTGDGMFAQNIPTNFIDNYKSVNVCDSLGEDSLVVFANNNETSRSVASLKVLNKYTLLVFDSINAKSAESILVESENLTAIGADQSRIRVVNATRGLPPLTVALGARYEQKSSKYPFSYSSGIILSSKQEFGDISSPVSLSKGTIPINVFTASEPAKLLYSARASIKENKSYLMVLTTDDNNNLKVILIDDELENTNVQYLEEGIFVQVVNAYSGENNLKISFNSQGGESAILVDAEVNFTNSIATVIDNKSQMISVNGINYEIIPETDKRVLVVATGDANSIRIFSNNFEPLNDNSTFKFRFVNASDIEILNVKKNTTDEAYIETIVKDNFSSYSTELRERKITYHFFDGDITGYIKRINDVLFTLGKSYSIIFTGFTTQNCFREYDKKNPNQEPNCYFIIIQQEF